MNPLKTGMIDSGKMETFLVTIGQYRQKSNNPFSDHTGNRVIRSALEFLNTKKRTQTL